MFLLSLSLLVGEIRTRESCLRRWIIEKSQKRSRAALKIHKFIVLFSRSRRGRGRFWFTRTFETNPAFSQIEDDDDVRPPE